MTDTSQLVWTELSEEGSIRQTEKAHLIRFKDKDVWIPDSQTHDTQYEGHGVQFQIPMWLAEKNDLEYTED